MKNSLTQVEMNILVGSILGDGNLALYGRSKNAYYREHGCDKQIDYRIWKSEKLKDLDFKFFPNHKHGKLCSPSHQIFTELYNMFYINKIKTITEQNVKLLNHPIGLACFYMDDGTLIIDSAIRKNKVKYLFPRIALYSLSFSKEENIILLEHIKNTFNIEFKLKNRPDGKHYILELNKQNEITKFIDLMSQIVKEIPCMTYKINIQERLIAKQRQLELNNIQSVISSLHPNDTSYSSQEVNLLVQLKKSGVSNKDIATTLNRSYWSVVDKIRRLRIEG